MCLSTSSIDLYLWYKEQLNENLRFSPTEILRPGAEDQQESEQWPYTAHPESFHSHQADKSLLSGKFDFSWTNCRISLVPLFASSEFRLFNSSHVEGEAWQIFLQLSDERESGSTDMYKSRWITCINMFVCGLGCSSVLNKAVQSGLMFPYPWDVVVCIQMVGFYLLGYSEKNTVGQHSFHLHTELNVSIQAYVPRSHGSINRDIFADVCMCVTACDVVSSRC